MNKERTALETWIKSDGGCIITNWFDSEPEKDIDAVFKRRNQC